MCRDHTAESHEGQALKVTKFQNRGVSGYLECRLCGHLTPGYVQKVLRPVSAQGELTFWSIISSLKGPKHENFCFWFVTPSTPI